MHGPRVGVGLELVVRHDCEARAGCGARDGCGARAVWWGVGLVVHGVRARM